MGYVIFDTCMLFDMGFTRSECASWVQAWGSILALIVAVAVPVVIRVSDHKKDQERIRSIGISAAVEMKIVVERAVVVFELAHFDLQEAAAKDPSVARLQIAMSEISLLPRAHRQNVENIRDLNPKLGALITVAFGEIDTLLLRSSLIGKMVPDPLQAKKEMLDFLSVFMVAKAYFNNAEDKLNDLLSQAEF